MLCRKGSEFSKGTKNKLARESAYHCSNPVCRKLIYHDGIFGHIIGASKSGPRGDPSMDPDELKDESNGLYLCFSCEKTVDAQPEIYPVKMLQNWKRLNKEQMSELRKKLLKDSKMSETIKAQKKEIKQQANTIQDQMNAIKEQDKTFQKLQASNCRLGKQNKENERRADKAEKTIQELEERLAKQEEDLEEVRGILKTAEEYIQTITKKFQEKLFPIPTNSTKGWFFF